MIFKVIKKCTFSLFLFSIYKLVKNENVLSELKEINCTYNELPKGFMLVDENNPCGPITTNRKLDNGKKRNLYSIVNIEDDSFYYNYNHLSEMANITNKKTEYLCEKIIKARTEGMKGYDITCPPHYSIVIDKSFYGRYANDTIRCSENINFTKKNLSRIKQDCGHEPTRRIKELCEGKVYCSILPCNVLLGDRCKSIYKYLHIDYHCKKNEVSKVLLFNHKFIKKINKILIFKKNYLFRN